MHLRIPAGPRRRTRRVLLAAGLAACALSGTAQASVVEQDTINGGLAYRANQETNTVTVRDFLASGLEVVDERGLTSRTSLCSSISSTTLRCAKPSRMNIQLGDRSDRATIATSIPVTLDGGLHDDTFIAGSGAAASRVLYRGGAGFDRISYANADRRVAVLLNGITDDGRIGLDKDHILPDVEQLGGSRFDDIIVDVGGSGGTKELIGGPGDDELRGGSSSNLTVFNMAPFADGADTVVGLGPMASVDYSKRSRAVTATLDHNGADDGEAGEGDEIRGTIGFISGGQAGDTIRARPGSTDGAFIDGQGGNDRLDGADGPDLIYAFAGADTVVTGVGNDIVRANDGFTDVIGCGAGDDSADVDSADIASSCETRRVGVLRLAPKTLHAKAGQTTRLKVSWRHPRAWKQLKTIELRLTQDRLPVGEITIRPRGERLDASGAVGLVRRATRLRRHGKTVTARLAIRLDDSLTGRTLQADVEATDRRGRRQLATAAATVRVAG